MKKSYVASILFKNGFMTGEANTREEAVSKCLENVRRNVPCYVKLSEGVLLPEEVAEEEILETVPSGYGLIILEQIPTGSGSSIFLFVAVKPGPFTLKEDTGGGESDERSIRQYVAGEVPLLHCCYDYNIPLRFKLPDGSLEFRDGAWQPASFAYFSCKDDFEEQT